MVCTSCWSLGIRSVDYDSRAQLPTSKRASLIQVLLVSDTLHYYKGSKDVPLSRDCFCHIQCCGLVYNGVQILLVVDPMASVFAIRP